MWKYTGRPWFYRPTGHQPLPNRHWHHQKRQKNQKTKSVFSPSQQEPLENRESSQKGGNCYCVTKKSFPTRTALFFMTTTFQLWLPKRLQTFWPQRWQIRRQSHESFLLWFSAASCFGRLTTNNLFFRSVRRSRPPMLTEQTPRCVTHSFFFRHKHVI